MSRNANSFFSEAPANVDMPRSRFKRPQNIKTSMNAGELVPIFIDEVLPGDTHTIDTSKVVRMSTLISPIMDDIYIDTYFFFVPNRLVWEHWKEFMGENTQSAWIPQVNYTIPQVTSPTGGWNVGTIADYFGVPTGIDNLSIDAMPFRAYTLICSEWFRNENLTDPPYFSKGDATVAGSNGNNYLNDLAKGGMPFKVAKYKDYFTSCLPAPQKASDVIVPIGNAAPVFTGLENQFVYPSTPDALHFKKVAGGNVTTGYLGVQTGSSDPTVGSAFSSNKTDLYNNGLVYPTNLYADLTQATGSSINQLRQAFQVQKFYEQLSRGGSRYTELIKGMFGVSSPDARLQRPEYLGGCRVPVNIHQVVQNSSTDNTSPQGNTAAYSLTIDSHSDFTKSFSEHGLIIGLACIRYNHTYQQGLERMWSRHTKEDFYFPVFSNLGEQSVKYKEIYAQGSAVTDAQGRIVDEKTFGYQEAWAEYRYKPNRCSGMMRSTYSQSLDFWHLGDDYSSLPSLSDAWIREDASNIDRTLAVTSAVSHQFIADIYVNDIAVRVMPLYSIPGLIDHH